LDLVFVSCGGGSGGGGGGGGARCCIVTLFNSLLPVCSSGGTSEDCRSTCAVDAFDDGSFTPPPHPLPSGDVVTQHYAVKWLPVSAAAGGSGVAWPFMSPPTVSAVFQCSSCIYTNTHMCARIHRFIRAAAAQVRCADVYLDGSTLFLIRYTQPFEYQMLHL
jgi:hypothetical protein